MTPAGRPHLLLTNDDGIEAPGLRALAEALDAVADVTIVAPKRERSGMSHAITVFEDLHVEPRPRGKNQAGWALDGTPADCVKVGLTVLARERPFDMVFSGINRGHNLGINVLYSGTIGAAREAALLGLPAVAVSLQYHDPDVLFFETAARVGREVFERVRRNGLPPGALLSVNVPPVDYDDLQGWRVTRMGDAGYSDLFHHEPPKGDRPGLYRNVGELWNRSTYEGDNLDDHALERDMVAITPLQTDQTAHDLLERLQGWF